VNARSEEEFIIRGENVVDSAVLSSFEYAREASLKKVTQRYIEKVDKSWEGQNATRIERVEGEGEGL